jgi:hypothetical protein
MAKKTQANELSQLLVFPFQDKDWVKKVIGVGFLLLIGFIPVLPIVLLLGYLAEIIQQIVVEGNPPELPDWDDLSKFFQEGFRLFGVGAVYMIPSTLLLLVGYAGFFVPIVFVETGAVSDAQGGGLILLGYLAGMGLMGIGSLLLFFTWLFLPLAGCHAAVKEDFKAAFKFRELGEIFKANWGGFLLAFMILIGGGVIIYYGSYFLVLTVILCCLYPFIICFLGAYLAVVGAALFGVTYRDAVTQLTVSNQK